ncbi:hypothetical protein QAD02_008229 [Eretmocerus hayati]|uniref:Uncharacterized protein n=1 Tax=Eretmocerus hayati TaxID=131215 RepID=A0ACC2N8A7_9HYME|nr:hypothetical protein QAD02_008229 [Eretmocerus hayati]
MEMSLEPDIMNEAIRKAIVSGDLQYVFDLLNSGLDVNHMIPFNDEDIIDTYVMRDSKKMKLCDAESKNSNSHKWFDEQEQEVMRMIDLISSIPDKTNHSLSLIHVAVRIENIELLAFLLKRKVKANILDYNYNTPLLCSALELALLKRQDLIVQCLILAGADLGHNKNSNSPILKKPLHLALQIGQVNSFALMLDRDIDINYVEPSGSCILDICLEALQLNNISNDVSCYNKFIDDEYDDSSTIYDTDDEYEIQKLKYLRSLDEGDDYEDSEIQIIYENFHKIHEIVDDVNDCVIIEECVMNKENNHFSNDIYDEDDDLQNIFDPTFIMDTEESQNSFDSIGSTNELQPGIDIEIFTID